MSTTQFVAHLKQKGIILKLVGNNQLSFKAQPGALTADLREQIVSNKQEIIALLGRASMLKQGPGERIGRAPEGAPIPLSFSQQRLYFFELLRPGTNTYFMPLLINLDAYPDLALVERCLERLINRHQAFRTRFGERDDKPVQIISPASVLRLAAIDLRSLPENQQQACTGELIARQLDLPFHMALGPLWRAMLLQTSAGKSLFLNMHHIISDGWSINLLLKEFHMLYVAWASAGPSPLTPLSLEYSDYAYWQRAWLDSEMYSKQADFWADYLEGAAHYLDLPRDHGKHEGRADGAGAGEFQVVMPAALALRLTQLFKQCRVTPFMGMLAFYGVLLMRYSGRRDLVVGTPVANRNHEGLSHVVGMFVNTLAIRMKLAHDAGMTGLLGEVRQSCLAAFSNQDMPFEKVLEINKVKTEVDHNPLFQTFFLFENNEDNGRTEPVNSGRSGNGLAPPVTAPKFELTLGITPHEGSFVLLMNFDRNLFLDATIASLAEHLVNLMDQGSAQPEKAIDRLSMLSEGEQNRILYTWNDTRTPAPIATLLHQPFEQQATLRPKAQALRFEEQGFTFAQLNARANHYAAQLMERGVGPEAVVALLLERSPEMVIAILAVLKAGAVYLPLDPELPGLRLELMLQDSRAQCLLNSPSTKALLQDGSVPCLQVLAHGNGALEDTGNPTPLCSGEHGAYLIYTSGSTGRPKGVLCTHKGICNRLAWIQRQDPMPAGSRSLQKTNYSFDVSIWEIFWPLWSGGCLVLAKPGGQKDPLYLVQKIKQDDINIIHFVPSMLSVFLETDTVETCTSLTRVYCSGEALTTRQQQRFHELFAVPLHNLYGPTEAAIEVTAWTCRPEDPATDIPIGRPIANMQAYVLDAYLSPLPSGIRGNLWLAGVGLARGYAGRPALTAASFLPNPFQDSGERLYRSGDIASYRPNGTIDFHGRLDGQIKMRGYRIECGEIERVLCSHPGLRDAVVKYWEDPDFQGLAAYFIAQEPAPDEQQLRAHLGLSLPQYMVPERLLRLDEFPMTPSGKTHRGALPLPPQPKSRAVEVPLLPPNPIRELVAEVWQSVLNREIGPTDHFFEIGGHSLLAVQVLSAIDRRIGVRLALRDLFEYPTLVGLSGHVAFTLRQNRLPSLPPLTHIPSQQPGPLSHAQERLWFLEQLDPGNPAYNLGLGFMLEGALDIGLLAACLTTIITRHKSLRTRFILVNGAPVQMIDETPLHGLTLVDLSALPTPEVHAQQHVAHEAMRSYDLSSGPLFEATFYRLAPDRGRLYLGMHHIISDGWSQRVLIGELLALYRAGNEAAILPGLPVDFADYARWQRGWLQGDLLEQQIVFWRQYLRDAPYVLALPWDKTRPARQDFRGANATFLIDQVSTEKLRELCKREGVTPFMALSSIFAILLDGYSHAGDMLIGTPMANRGYADTQDLIGFFANTTVMRFSLDRGESFARFMAETRERLLDSFPHQDMPFETLVEQLSPPRNLGHTPIFQVMYTHQTIEMQTSDMALPGIRVRAANPAEEVAKFDLTLHTAFEADHIAATLNYATAVFHHETIARMLAHFTQLVTHLLHQPDIPLARISLLSEQEKQRLTQQWNQGRLKTPDTNFIELFEKSLGAHGERTALLWDGRGISYAEVNTMANRWAARLRQAHVGLDVPVALMIPRSAEAVVAILAILKAGGAYIPLDPMLGQERLTYILSDSGAALLLTTPEIAAHQSLPAHTVTLYVEELEKGIQDLVAPARVLPDNLAYIIYTSGSTGHPKGCLIQHGGLVNYLLWALSYYQLEAGACLPLHSSLAFDMSVTTLLLPLICGATIDVYPELTIGEAVERMDAGVTHATYSHIKLTPAHLDLLNRQAVGTDRSNRSLVTILGGEALYYQGVRRWWQDFPQARVINEYGPTETVVGCCVHEPQPADVGHLSVAIGKPIANTRCYLVNAHLDLVAPGVHGELLLGGAGLARGYMNRPALTAAVFVPDPFSGERGSRLYRSGDLVRLQTTCSATGKPVNLDQEPVLEYLGRRDLQIKLRGYRIEPGEIEFRLNQHAGVRESVVISLRFGENDNRLVAYVVALDKPPRPEEMDETLKKHLSASLPEYMLPTHFVYLERLPLASSGKLNRANLPAPQVDAFGSTPPSDDVQRAVLACFNQVLSQAQTTVEVSFFALGGHSLLTIKLVDLIRERLDIDIAPALVFTHPTVAALASAIREQQTSGHRHAQVISLQDQGEGVPMFWVHAITGSVSPYQDLALALGTNRPFLALASPGLRAREQPKTTITDLAAHQVATLAAVYPEGPIYLGGWSFGGVTAFEMARQLTEKGRLVAFLALIDSQLGQQADVPITTQLYYFAMDLGLDVTTALKEVDTNQDREKLLALICEHAIAQGVLPFSTDPEDLRRLFFVYQTHWNALATYRAGAYHGPVTLFHEHDYREENLMLWREQCSRLQTQSVPGDHHTMITQPHVNELAYAIQKHFIYLKGEKP